MNTSMWKSLSRRSINLDHLDSKTVENGIIANELSSIQCLQEKKEKDFLTLIFSEMIKAKSLEEKRKRNERHKEIIDLIEQQKKGRDQDIRHMMMAKDKATYDEKLYQQIMEQKEH